MTTTEQTTITEKEMDYIQVEWDFLEDNLTTEVYEDITVAYHYVKPVKLSNYALQVVLKRWMWEYPTIKQLNDSKTLFKILHSQSQMEEEILNSTICKRQRAMAITDMEMLDARGVDLFKEIRFVINDLE